MPGPAALQKRPGPAPDRGCLTRERIQITVCNARRGVSDIQIDAVDVGAPELTSPRLQRASGWQVAPARHRPVACWS